MKPTLLFTALAVVLAAPSVQAKSELETLRALCKEQERQIHLLEDSNAKLRSMEPPSRSKSAAAPAAPVAAANSTSSSSTYTVKPGDSFGRIANKTGTTAEKLAAENGLKISSIIRPGQQLKLPGNGNVAKTAEVPAPRSSASTHKVVQGETFFSIAKKHGISTADLIAANPSIKPSAMRPGQVVNLVDSRSSSTTVLSSSARSSSTRAASAPANRTPAAVPNNIPVSTPAPKPAEAPAAPVPENKIHTITINDEVTYGDFASKHGTDTARLNSLNGLDLTNATVLAKGSELYVPGQP